MTEAEYNKTRELFQLFLYRVFTMREQQKRYEHGDYNAKVIATRMAAQVDNAMHKLINDFGYNMGEITKKYEQQNLF